MVFTWLGKRLIYQLEKQVVIIVYHDGYYIWLVVSRHWLTIIMKIITTINYICFYICQYLNLKININIFLFIIIFIKVY